ncbi:MAG: hypothetical protein KatS3mg076_2474 [Candidatus Binatia bacterium]|nr:MAG: hypothetical protein KatS3mg076_2474 [Candidatus Binatia bacterium]
MVNFEDQSEPIAFEPFDHPDLPEGPPAVEPPFHDPSRKLLELPFVTRPGKTRVTDVVVEVEALVVHPDGVVKHGNVGELLAVAGDAVKIRRDVLPDLLGIDAAVGLLQGAGLENHRRGDVHGGVVPLEKQEGVVECTQALVGVSAHDPEPPAPALPIVDPRRGGQGKNQRPSPETISSITCPSGSRTHICPDSLVVSSTSSPSARKRASVSS